MQKQERLKYKQSANSTKVEKNATAALRAELELEIQNKRQCSYETYECTQLSIEGYKYCSKHILCDKSAPYKQCSYVYQTNGKRCYLPAPKGEKKEYGYCREHALKSTLTKNKQNSKFPPPHTAEVLLHSLSHYVKKPKNKSYPSSEDFANNHDEGNELKCTMSVDPFEMDASVVYNTRCNDILDLCSESESDIEPSTYSSVWHDAHADSSDNESADSEQEDLLKHANVFTAEEITQITRDKLIRLQSLYIEQYRHLQHVLREKKRKYIHALKREKETCCNIYNQVRDNPKEQRLYKKLKYYNKYHRNFGEEAILSKRLHDLRAKISDGVAVKAGNLTKCTFSEGGVKCGERVLPMTKHCRKHILEDQNQILFKACGKTNDDVDCSVPVEAIFDDSTCRLHTDIPVLRSYSQPRKESESEIEESLDHLPDYTLSSTDNVKTELIDYRLPTELPKMKTLPTMLFEESAESLQPNIQGETSDFNSFTNELYDTPTNLDQSLEEAMDDTKLDLEPDESSMSLDANNLDNTLIEQEEIVPEGPDQIASMVSKGQEEVVPMVSEGPEEIAPVLPEEQQEVVPIVSKGQEETVAMVSEEPEDISPKLPEEVMDVDTTEEPQVQKSAESELKSLGETPKGGNLESEDKEFLILNDMDKV